MLILSVGTTFVEGLHAFSGFEPQESTDMLSKFGSETFWNKEIMSIEQSVEPHYIDIDNMFTW